MSETPTTGTTGLGPLDVVKVVLKHGGTVMGLLAMTVELALKLKSFFAAAAPEISVAIENFNGQAAATNKARIDSANAWLRARGLPEVIAPTR